MTSYRDSRSYGVEEICELLRAVDGHLTRPARLVIIGGAAAAFHRAESTTTDVDTHDPVNADLEDAVLRARADTGLDIVVCHSAIADAPYNFEDRLVRQLPELTKLEVWVLEKHDLALSKAIRCVEHDLQQLEEVHSRSGLRFDILLERFRAEMGHVMGDPDRLRRNFLDLIERLFGETKRVEADRRTR